MQGAAAPGSPAHSEWEGGRRSGQPVLWLCPSNHGATSLSKTLLTSPRGTLGSVLGPLAQSADRLTHQEGEHGPAVGCGWGQTISLVTPKTSSDSHALSPVQVENSYSSCKDPFSSHVLREA